MPSSQLWLLLYLTTGSLVIVAAYVSTQIRAFKHLRRASYTCLELTPPGSAAKSPLATTQFFASLHSLGIRQTRQDQFFDRKPVVTLEIISTREQGIRYVARLSQRDLTNFQHLLTSYLPNVKFREVPDELKTSGSKHWKTYTEYKQSGHFARPLNIQASLADHDPVAFLTGTMTQLAPNEAVLLQLILQPTRSRSATRLRDRLLAGQDLDLRRRGFTVVIFWPVMLLGIILRLISVILSGFTRPESKPATNLNPRVTMTSSHELLAKLSEAHFKADLRLFIASDTKVAGVERTSGFAASLASFTVPGSQALVSRRRFPQVLTQRILPYKLIHRLPSFLSNNSSLLAVSEIAGIFHFPYGSSTRTENIAKSYSKSLPAPVSLKQGTAPDILIGANVHHGQVTPIGLTAAERERHTYIIGGTGNGKTTMLQYAIVQDITSGKGVAVIDPHGDLAETILRHIPENRIKDVIYFSPDDLDHPVGLNLLELPPGLEGNDLLREKDLVTESVISLFRKIFSDSSDGGHRIEYVLRNTIQTALTLKDSTLFTIFDLLNDPKFRRSVVKDLENKDLRNFWINEMGDAGSFQRVKMIAGITAKIGRFLFSASAKQILEQPRSTINFDDIIDSGKIFVCNFSKGLLGEDTSELFGIAVLTKLQLAVYRRARALESDRRPFYLYVDEFQNFATPSFTQLLSEARKYKFYLTMAEQSTAQQPDQRMNQMILANVGTVVCFRTGSPVDEELLLPLFQPFVEAGEIANLSSFNFYMKISAVTVQEPFSGETVLLSEPGSSEVMKQVIDQSRTLYSKSVEKIVVPKSKTPKHPKLRKESSRVQSTGLVREPENVK